VKSTEKEKPLDALIVAVPESSGSALYGMFDVLSVTGSIWQTLSRTGGEQNLIRPRIVSVTTEPFLCGNGIPVQPALDIKSATRADILVLPELWLGPDEDLHGRYPELIDWIHKKYREGSYIYSACSGSIMLAETGLLNGCDATSHWGYEDMFHKRYPKVQFRTEPNLAFADPGGRIVTAGGTTSWHDLAIHIIARHCNPGEALNIAKVYLLKWHGEGQLPYATLVRRNPHADSIVRACEKWLSENFHKKNCISQVVKMSKIPERSLKRRFKTAAGSSLIEYIQNLRVEESKRQLESGNTPVDDISVSVGYEDPAFFRRLFKRSTGLTPSQYRRMFQPVARVLSLNQ
jgi:transcriptional regulator GlxA family with amidase domain